MPKPRKLLIALEATPYYHCVSRCVRRAFLCGEDTFSGKRYEHRRQWIEDRLAELAGVFAIDVCAFAVMSNHTHLILHVDADRAKRWSEREVVERWLRLHGAPLVVERFAAGEPLSGAELDQVDRFAGERRKRLMDISWYMRELNEFIARRANREDGCTGRFWEGRFYSQALLDEKALLSCMAYVDLNPVRAKMAETPERSDYTSIQRRIRSALGQDEETKKRAVELMPFVGDEREAMPKGLPFHLRDYLELVDWSGRALVAGKRGAIPESLPPILQRLQFDPRHWLYLTRHFESRLKGWVGMAHLVKATCRQLGYQRTPGLGECRALFPT